MHTFKISASILSADFAQLGKEVTDVILAGVDWIHIDVMDNHYVPNLTMGPLVCKALRDYGIRVPLDVHLMVKPVDHLIHQFAKAGATYITIHPEATDHLDRSLQLIRDLGCGVGLAFNPASPVHPLPYVIDKLDFILLMSVNPGFGNQSFIPTTFTKIKKLRSFLNKHGYKQRLQVDGGIKVNNIKEVATAGADTFVIGSAIFGEQNTDATGYATVLANLQAELSKVRDKEH